MLLCVSVSEKLWRDTLYTGLRAKPHSEMTTAIAPISMSSSGAIGTGECSLRVLTPSLPLFYMPYINEPYNAITPVFPICVSFITSPF